MNAVLHDLPLPARLVPWPSAAHTTLTRCVLLALLLHFWLLLMLGTAPSGTAEPGQGVGGRLNITLRGPVAEGPALEAVPQPEATPAPGRAPETAAPRWGGAVRQTEPSPDSPPGAAQLGVPAMPAPAAAPPAETAPAPQSNSEPGRVQQEMPTTAEPAAVPQPEPAPAEGRLMAPAPAAPGNILPLLPTAPLPRAMVLPAPASPLPAPADPEPAPAREIASPLLQGPRVVPVPALSPTPAVPSTPRENTSTLPTPAALPDVAPAPLPRAPAAPPVPALPGLPSAPADVAAPDAGSRVGQDVATPGAAASAPPRLKLDLVRPRGGELSRYNSMGALPVLPRPPERDDKLARDIDKAGKPDCRNAYAGAGPLAVVPLAVDALRKEGGCKW
jgi:hypothetical protein